MSKPTLQWDATTGVREERDRRPAVPVFLLTYLKVWLPVALNTMYSTVRKGSQLVL